MQLEAIAVILVTVATLGAPSARACSCVGRSPAEYFAAADTVFVGVARERTLDVLHVMKGRPGARVRIGDLTPCSPTYQPGEIAIVFMKDKQLSLCDGNYGLAYLLEQLGLADMIAAVPEPLNASENALGVPSQSAFAEAFNATLTPYLSARPRVRVRGLPAGECPLRVAGSDFASVSDEHADVTIEHAIRRGELVFIAGVMPAENVRFAVLMTDRERSALVYGRAVTPALAPSYRCASDLDCTLTCSSGAVNATWFGKHHTRIAQCEDGCTSKGAEAPRCVEGACTAFFGGARADECTRRPIAWR